MVRGRGDWVMLNNVVGLLNDGVIAPLNSYESISTVTVGSGGQASVTFSSIPSTYKHLQIRAIMRDQRATFGNSGQLFRFNSDTGSNYSWHNLQGDGSSASARNAINQASMSGNTSAASGAPTNDFGAMVVDILDYADTNKYKTIRMLSGVDVNGTVASFGGVIELMSGSWRNTAAITSVTILPSVANIVQYSSFALYGIKG